MANLLLGSGAGVGSGSWCRESGPGLLQQADVSRGGGQCGQATKGTRGMSWRQEARKGVRRLRNARRSCQTSVDAGVPESAHTESIGVGGEPRELKHLSTW